MLTEDDVPALRTFLESPERPRGTLGYHELCGFVYAVVSAPELIPPSEWLPMIFDHADPNYADLYEAQGTLERLMTLYNQSNTRVLDRKTSLDPGVEFRDDVLANLDTDAPVSRWARGFVTGHSWLEEVWDDCVPDELEGEFAACLMTLSFFASRSLAEDFVKETVAPGRATDIETVAATMRELFPDALASYAELGRTIYEVRVRTEDEVPVRTGAVRAGRNEPCPCGSGKKFKKCCGSNVQ